MNRESLTSKTIRDFGEQWSRFTENRGYYGSQQLFADIVRPLLDLNDFRGAHVAELGSGTGRIVRMMMEAGAAHVIALEPSAAMTALRRNTREWASRIDYLDSTAEHLPPGGDLDLVVSIGVLHHIPQPEPAVQAAYAALKPGGRFLAWLYGREGNDVYLALANPARKLTQRLPHAVLSALSWALSYPLGGYAALCGRLPLPMADYMRMHIRRLSPADRRLTIYDQLNPAWAKYYTEREARSLVEQAGFERVQLHHRHGYSWTVLGVKPAT